MVDAAGMKPICPGKEASNLFCPIQHETALSNLVRAYTMIKPVIRIGERGWRAPKLQQIVNQSAI